MNEEEIYKRGKLLDIVAYEVGGNLYTIGKTIKHIDSAIPKNKARLANIGRALPSNIILNTNETKN